MASLIMDERDQRFVLNEMLEIEKLCEKAKFAEFSGDMFEMILTEARKFAENRILPTLVEGDRVGCRLENGQVHVPPCFAGPYKLFCEGGWNVMSFPSEEGGQGLPVVIRTAAHEWFGHNFSFMSYPGTGEGAAHLIAVYGTEAQKKKYMEKMVTGQWGGTMVLTEPGAGSDVGNLSTKAVRQPDGTFRLQGSKIFITAGDHDLVDNIIHPVLARIEGDPAGTKGISLFLVPKYLVNEDGSLGKRNDFEIAKIEEKLGIHGSSTCAMNFGDNGQCYAELLGEEKQGMKIMFQMMNEARLGVGLQGVAAAAIAYQHAVQYARDRLQGSSLMDFKNPEAPRVPILQHPDVRRMLLWMKSNTESLRALAYFCAYCFDKERTAESDEDREKWIGYAEVLTPIVKAYCSDIAFRVTETAMQVYGGYGYCSEYPVEQFMRDEKIASIYEGANGIQAMDLVVRKLGMKKGSYFMSMLGEMNATVARFQNDPGLADLAGGLQAAVHSLGEAAIYFSQCGKQGNFFVPLAHSYPFLMMMGKVVSGWLLFWGAGVAAGKLDALCRAQGVDRADPAAWNDLVKRNQDAAFYAGKMTGAKFYIKNVLPEVGAAVAAIQSGDLSVVEIADESFSF
jgi:alkylation response protein AidB-like acyl-CoA dehydrogenase